MSEPYGPTSKDICLNVFYHGLFWFLLLGSWYVAWYNIDNWLLLGVAMFVLWPVAALVHAVTWILSPIWLGAIVLLLSPIILLGMWIGGKNPIHFVKYEFLEYPKPKYTCRNGKLEKTNDETS